MYASDVSEYQELCEQLTWVPLNDVSVTVLWIKDCLMPFVLVL